VLKPFGKVRNKWVNSGPWREIRQEFAARFVRFRFNLGAKSRRILFDFETSFARDRLKFESNCRKAGSARRDGFARPRDGL
jgi:hypothetical protein